MDETGMWLRGLEQPEKTTEPEPAADDTAMWLKSLEEEKVSEAEPAADETAIWLKSIEEEKISEFEPAADETATWLKNLEEEKPSQPEPAADETAMWLKGLEEEKAAEPEPAADQTLMWLKNLDETESGSEIAPSIESGMPEWLQSVEETPVAESNIPVQEPAAMEESKLEEESLPSWLAELDQEEERPVSTPADEDLPAWLRAEEAPPSQAEPTRPSDWKHVEESQPEITFSPAMDETTRPEIIYSPPLEETKESESEVAAPALVETPREEPTALAEEKAAEPVPEPQSFQRMPVRPTPVAETGKLSIPIVDPTLGSARNDMSRNNVPGALESYARLIKKGRFLDEVIYDLRDALYRYPVEVNIWQSLGDAYMRANRLQDALDAYTKAEELLR
jgi:tetratricopeptide (TPR) repeat protein